ncbi:hypothetical protein V2G26_001330 [Clonostachys chloroleuca]
MSRTLELLYRGLKIAYFGFCTTHLHPSESMAILQSQETRKVSGLLIPPVQGPCEFLQATMLLSRDSDEERKAKVKSITDIVYICSLVVYLVWNLEVKAPGIPSYSGTVRLHTSESPEETWATDRDPHNASHFNGSRVPAASQATSKKCRQAS